MYRFAWILAVLGLLAFAAPAAPVLADSHGEGADVAAPADEPEEGDAAAPEGEAEEAEAEESESEGGMPE